MEKKYFNINTEKFIPLSEYSLDKITITRVEVVNGEASDLSNLIIIKNILNNAKDEPIQPFVYYSGINPGHMTDKPMQVLIMNCNDKEMKIQPINDKRIEFRIQYSI